MRTAGEYFGSIATQLIEAFQHYNHIQPTWHNNSISTWMTNFLIMSEAAPIGYSKFTRELHNMEGNVHASCLSYCQAIKLLSLCSNVVSWSTCQTITEDVTKSLVCGGVIHIRILWTCYTLMPGSGCFFIHCAPHYQTSAFLWLPAQQAFMP